MIETALTIQIFGIAGAAMVLTAFFLTNYPGYNNDKTKLDETLNFLGSFMLMGNAYMTGAWPFLVLNIVWASWSLHMLVRKHKKRLPWF